MENPEILNNTQTTIGWKKKSQKKLQYVSIEKKGNKTFMSL